MEQLVQLPEEIKLMIAMLLTLFVTQALKWLSAQLGMDLSGYSAQVTAYLVAGVLFVVNAALSHIPVEFAPIAGQVLALIVVVLASGGAYKKFIAPK